VKHIRQDIFERFRVAGHFQSDVKAFLHSQLLHCFGYFLCADIQCEICAHFAREIKAICIHVRDDDVTRAGAFANRNGHATDRPGAGDEDVFSHQIERERRVHGVAQRIETGKNLQWN
jgi:hypothetical protein